MRHKFLILIQEDVPNFYLEIFMKKIVFIIFLFLFCSASVQAEENDTQKLLRDSVSVMEEIMNSPDQEIPSDLISQARAILIFPTLIKAGFMLGARYGEGVAPSVGAGCRRLLQSLTLRAASVRFANQAPPGSEKSE